MPHPLRHLPFHLMFYIPWFKLFVRISSEKVTDTELINMSVNMGSTQTTLNLENTEVRTGFEGKKINITVILKSYPDVINMVGFISAFQALRWVRHHNYTTSYVANIQICSCYGPGRKIIYDTIGL